MIESQPAVRALGPQLEPAPPRADAAPAIRASAVLTSLVEHWLAVTMSGLLLAVAVTAFVMTRPRRFDAAVTVAPVGNARQLNLPAGLASSLLGGGGAGLQATPVFVARLAHLRSVLDEVAVQRVPGDARTIVERLTHRPLADVRQYEYADEIGKAVRTTIDRESGTVTIDASLADTALARAMISGVVDAVRRAYTRTTKSQATELREAQVTRVDSASREVRRAQGALVAFLSSNRVVPEHSPLWVEQQRLQGAEQVAQTIYTQAVTELQTARGKELEDAPALVVLDPLPPVFAPHGRGTVPKAIFAFVLGVLLSGVAVVVREAAANAYAAGGEDSRRLVAAASRLPVVGGRRLRWFLRL